MKKFKNLICLPILFVAFTASAQNVGIGTNSPDASAKLDVVSTDKGLLIPRVDLNSSSDGTTIPSPATGLIVWNTGSGSLTSAGLYYNSGTSGSPNWVRIVAADVDKDWFEAGTTESPNDISDNIYTQGNISVGDNNPMTAANIKLAGIDNNEGGEIQLDGGANYIDSAFAIDNYEGRLRILGTTNTGGTGGIGTNEIVTFKKSGQVGIGTNNPLAKLDVRGNISLNDNQLRLRDGNDGNHWLGFHTGGGFDGAKLRGNLTISLQTGNMEVVLRDGKMGVGTSAPSNGRLHVAGYSSYTSGGGNYFDANFGDGAGTSDFNPYTFNVSIYSENDLVVSGKIAAESDVRIKDIQGISDASCDLTTLMSIEITDYNLKDRVRFGNQQFKKVIAQQIEEVFPLAVNTMTNFIPNIYTTVTVENGLVSLKGDIEVGDKLKVFNKEGEERIIAIRAMEGNSCILEEDFTGEIFVYGKQVNDFRGVDYDAISMLNVSATQEQQRLIEQLQSENDELKAKVAELSLQAKKIDEVESQLSTIMSALQSGGIVIDWQALQK